MRCWVIRPTSPTPVRVDCAHMLEGPSPHDSAQHITAAVGLILSALESLCMLVR
jgi:hypothetical protein